jgi:hypothetical protein
VGGGSEITEKDYSRIQLHQSLIKNSALLKNCLHTTTKSIDQRQKDVQLSINMPGQFILSPTIQPSMIHFAVETSF